MNEQKQIFTNIYNNHSWGGVSRSGPGSDLSQTTVLINELPKIFKDYNIETFLDAPCGDYHWMQYVEKSDVDYIGGDIVLDIIKTNNLKYSNDKTSFMELDILTDNLPTCDMIFVRDCLVHFPISSIFKFLLNLTSSNIKFLMTTSFINRTSNYDISFGEWRQLNLLIQPFNLQKPLAIINENCTENGGVNSDKSMCIWSVDDIRRSLMRYK